MTFRNSLILGLLAITAVACGIDSDDNDDQHEEGALTNTCTAEVSYEKTAAPFLASYCTTCHSAASTNRDSAPPGVNFDTLPGVTEHGRGLLERVQLPAGDPLAMPPARAKTKPGAADVAAFVSWLNCSGVGAVGHMH